MPRSRSGARRRGAPSQAGTLAPSRLLAGLVEAVKANRVVQLGILGLLLTGIVLFLLVRGCGDQAAFRRSQAAAKELEEARRAAGQEEVEQQPGAKPPQKKEVPGGKSGNADKRAAPVGQPAGDEEEVQQPGARPPSRTRKGKAAAAPARPAVAVVLPEKFADWAEKDFLLAKSAGDRRLLPALEDRVQRAAGTESEASLYVALLRSSPQGPLQLSGDDDENPRPGRLTASGLVAFLVNALAANGTPPARDALRQLLAGALTTDDDPAAIDTVLKNLAERPGQENEELFYQVLTAPGKLRPTGQGSVGADAIQAKACDLARNSGTDRLRVRMAEAAVDAAMPQDLRKRLRAVIEPPDPRNTEAQIVLYQGGFLERPARLALEKKLSAISSETLTSLLGNPLKKPTLADARLAQQACARLWDQPFTAWLAGQPQRIESLEEGASLLLLAATIPSERVRAKLLRTLKRYVDAGPSALARTGMGASVAPEPGFLPVLKSVERHLQQSSRGDAVRSIGAIRSEEVRKQLLQRQEQKEKLAREWNDFSEAVLRTWCRCLHAAATNGGPPATSRGAAGPSPIELSFRTHANGEEAEMVGAYRLDLPAAAGSGLADRMDLLQVRYARIEERTRLSRVVEFYRRQLDCEVWSLDDGVWLDCLLIDPPSGRRRSLDVLITRRVKTKPSALPSGVEEEEQQPGRRRGRPAAKPAASSSARPKWKPGLLPDDEEELIVDILSMEVNLPEE